jgi:hypothetical protein
MRSRILHLFLALGLAMSIFAGIAVPGSANEPFPQAMYFPWVPNGSMLGTMGPFYGAVTVQNLEGVAVTLYFRSWTSATPTPRPLIPYASYTLSADELGVPAPGAAVNFWTVKEDNSSGRLAATLKLTSPVAPQVPAFEARTSNAHVTVDGHTGMSEQFLVAEHVLPIVQTNSGWNTAIRATNVQPVSAADIEVELTPQGGGTPIIFTEQNVASGATATFDLLARGIPEGFVGAARIIRYNAGTTNKVGRVVAIAERYKPSTNMLLVNPAQPVTYCISAQYAPIVFDNYFNWNTGISIANDSGQTNDITVTIYRTDGTIASETPLSIPPLEAVMNFLARRVRTRASPVALGM